MMYRVIDNFLDEEYFNSLCDIFLKDGDYRPEDPHMPWLFDTSISDDPNDNLFYMWHVLYEQHSPKSQYFNSLLPLLDILGVRCPIQIKANFYPNTHTIHEHKPHVDYTYPNSGALLSFNTCDGYTKLKDGTKIQSVANRMLFHDPIQPHSSSTTTNTAARINMNINFIPQNFHLKDDMMVNENWNV